jgi:hypothetical protein
VNIERDPHCLVCGEPMRQHATLADGDDSSLSLADLMDNSGLVLEDRSGDN